MLQQSSKLGVLYKLGWDSGYLPPPGEKILTPKPARNTFFLSDMGKKKQKGGVEISVVAWDPALNAGEDESDAFFSLKDQTGIEDEEDEPRTPARVTALEQNWPNPFNGVTTISFTIGEPCAVDLRIYDTAGRLIRTIETGAARGSGRHAVVWDGRDNDGRPVASGVYFTRFSAGKHRETRKMVYLR